MAETQNPILKAYKVLRWFILAGAVSVLYLAMKTPARHGPENDPALQKQQAEAFQEKIGALATAHREGSSSEVTLEAAEINAAMADSMGAAQSQPGKTVPVPVSTPESSSAQKAPTQQPGDGQIKDARVEFSGDIVTGYFVTQVYGQDVHLTVAGRLGSKDGYVTFDPTSFKVGDLSIPVSMVDPALQKKLAEPENRDKLKLPDFVADLRVVNSRLIVAER